MAQDISWGQKFRELCKQKGFPFCLPPSTPMVEKGVAQSLLVCVPVFYDDAAVWWARGWENENEMLSCASLQGNDSPKYMFTTSFKVKSSQISDLIRPAKILQHDDAAVWWARG